jgi:acetyltransferase-like isoleucine patch superfamily enzyme
MRKKLEKLAEMLASVAVLPVWLNYRISAMLIGRVRAGEHVGQMASRWVGVYGVFLRRALFRMLLPRMGKGVTIHYGALLTKMDAEIGNRVGIGAYSMLGRVRIGDNTMIADHVLIPSGGAQHGTARLDVPMRDQKGEFRTITIGEDCWIGSNSVILADIGNHVIIGVGSVVTKPIPDYMIAVGNPARPVRDRRAPAEAPPQTDEQD